MAAGASLRLTLPPVIHAVPGVEMNVFFANTVLLESNAPVTFACVCPVGKTDDKRWTLTAEDAQVGRHSFRLTVTSGERTETAESTVVVSPRGSGSVGKIRLLLIGDSLTHASQYPNEIARLLKRPGNPAWEMLGTHRPRGAREGVRQEGYGGWTWARFRQRFNPERPYPGKTNSSPFVFPKADGTGGQVDVARYVAEHCGNKRPDFVTVMLGINDCFAAKPDSPATIDPRIDAMFREADLLLADVRKALPEAEIGICLTPPGNSRDAAFEATYKGRYPRWGWRRIQHRLVERQLAHFGGREAENLHVVPTQLNLDVVNGYPERNGVHPNAAGYAQIGASIYSWLKSRLVVP